MRISIPSRPVRSFALCSLVLANLTLAISSQAQDPTATLYAAHNEAEISAQAIAPVVAWLRNQRFALRLTSTDSLKLDPLTESDPEIEGDTDEASKARKILSKVTGKLYFTANAYKKAKLYWIGGDSVKRSADVSIFDDRSSDGTTFRKLFRVSTPTKLANYSVSTKRTLSLDTTIVTEDEVRIFSPLTGRPRVALQANRSDPLFGGAISVDDLTVASENLSSFDVRVVAERELLLPFLKPSLVKAEVGSSVAEPEEETEGKKKQESFSLQTVPPKSGEFVNWNFESRELPQFSPWVPTNIYFVPRPVWIIELLSKDPYFPHGKEYLVIDKELFLPFYKMVYDRIGDYRKTVVGSWALIDTGGKLTKQKVPFVTFVLAVDQSTEIVNVLNTQSVELALEGNSGAMQIIEKWFKQTNPPEKKSEVPSAKTGTPESDTADEEVEDSEAAAE